jgi:hypothetical protein
VNNDKMSIVVFWVVTPCGLVGGYDISNERDTSTLQRRKIAKLIIKE